MICQYLRHTAGAVCNLMPASRPVRNDPSAPRDPNVPTMQEEGYDGFEATTWYGLAQAFAHCIRSEQDNWAKAVKDANVKVES